MGESIFLVDVARRILSGQVEREAIFEDIRSGALASALDAPGIRAAVRWAQSADAGDERLGLLVMQLCHGAAARVCGEDLSRQIAGVLGGIYVQRGELELGEAHLELAERSARAAGARSEELVYLINRVTTYALRRDVRMQQELLEAAITLAGDIGEDERLPQLLKQKGSLLRQMGRLEDAVAIYREALEHVRRTEERTEEGAILGNLANVLTELDRRGEALPLYRESIERAHACGQARTAANNAANLARTLLECGDAEAAEAFGAAARLYEAIDRLDAAAKEYEQAALLALGDDATTTARRDAEQALSLARRSGDPAVHAGVAQTAAMVEAHEGALDSALQFSREAIDAARRAGAAVLLAEQLSFGAHIASRCGIDEEALALCRELVGMVRDLDDPSDRVRLLDAWAPAVPILELAVSWAGDDIAELRRRVPENVEDGDERLLACGRLVHLLAGHDDRLALGIALLIEPELGALDRELRIRFAHRAGAAAYRLGRLEDAERLVRIGLAAVEKHAATLESIQLWNILGVVLRNRGCDDDALTAFQQAERHSDPASYPTLHAEILGNHGNVCADRGELDEARRLFEQSQMLAEQAGDRRELARTTAQLGELELRRGAFKAAIPLIEKALAAYGDLGESFLAATAHVNLAQAHESLGQHAEAGPHAEAALSLARRTGHERVELAAQLVLGRTACVEDRIGDGIRSLRAGVSIARRRNEFAAAAGALRHIASVEYRIGRTEAALEALREAVEFERAAGRSEELANTIAMLEELEASGRAGRNYMRPATDAAPGTHDASGSELIDGLQRFAAFVASLDLSSRAGQVRAIRYVEEHPELLGARADSILARGTAESAHQEQGVVLAACRSLLAELRERGVRAAMSARFGLDKASPAERGPSIVVQQDGKTAVLSLRDDEGDAAIAERLGMFFSRGIPIEIDDLDDRASDGLVERLPVWIREAEEQGADTVAAVLRGIPASFELFRRVRTLKGALQIDDVNLWLELDRAVALPARHDRMRVLNDVLSQREAGDAPLDRILSALGAADLPEAYKRHFADEIAAYRKERSSEAESPGQVPKPALDDSRLLTIARRLASREIDVAQARDEVRTLETRELLAWLTVDPEEAVRCHAAGAQWVYFLVATAPGMDSARFVPAVFLSLAALASGGTTPAPILDVLMDATEQLDRIVAAGNREMAFAAAEIGNNLALLEGRMGRTRKAVERLNASLLHFQTVGILEGQLTAQRNLGAALREDFRPKEAIDAFRRAITTAEVLRATREHASALRGLGLAYADVSDFPAAIDAYGKALELVPAHGAERATILLDLATAHRHLRRPQQARELYQETQRLFERASDRLGVARSMANLGNIDRDLGDPEAGLALYRRALELAPDAPLRDRATWTSNQGAALYEMGAGAKAAHVWATALPMHQDAGDIEMVAAVQTNLAILYADRGEGSAALEAVREARRTFEALANPRREAQILLVEAMLRDPEGDASEARRLLERAVDLARTSGDRMLECNALSLLGLRAFEAGDHERARDLWEDALTMSANIDPQVRADVLANLARYHSVTVKDRARALALLREAVELVESVRSRVDPTTYRAGFLGRFAGLYESIVTTHVDLGFVEEAFGFAERMRARTLVDLFAGEQPDVGSLAELRDLVPPDSLMVEFVILRRETLVFLVPGAGIEVVEHAMAATREDEWTWVAGARLGLLRLRDFALRELNGLLGNDTSGWMAAVHAKHGDQDTDALRETQHDVLRALHDVVAAPLLDRISAWRGIRSAVVVPHRGLHFLPLHAASSDETDPVTGSVLRVRMLDERLALSFAPSATVWAHAVRRGARRFERVVTVGDPTGDLLFARAEAESSHGGAVGRPEDVLIGKHATSDAVFARVADADLLHLACHGVWEWGDPTASGLVFADRRVTVTEIMRLEMRPGALVVLSACETGLVDRADLMDEYLGLPGAFLRAGARAVLATLWRVDDAAAALLTTRFLESLLHEHKDAATALREACAWLRRASPSVAMAYARRQFGESTVGVSACAVLDERLALPSTSGEPPFSDPRYWAAFILVGSS